MATALLNARKLEYDPVDMQSLAYLAQALQVAQPAELLPLETPTAEATP